MRERPMGEAVILIVVLLLLVGIAGLLLRERRQLRAERTREPRR